MFGAGLLNFASAAHKFYAWLARAASQSKQICEKEQDATCDTPAGACWKMKGGKKITQDALKIKKNFSYLFYNGSAVVFICVFCF